RRVRVGDGRLVVDRGAQGDRRVLHVGGVGPIGAQVDVGRHAHVGGTDRDLLAHIGGGVEVGVATVVSLEGGGAWVQRTLDGRGESHPGVIECYRAGSGAGAVARAVGEEGEAPVAGRVKRRFRVGDGRLVVDRGAQGGRRVLHVGGVGPIGAQVDVGRHAHVGLADRDLLAHIGGGVEVGVATVV